MQFGSKRYTLGGENNPYWVLAEPILLDVWAKGISRTSSTGLQAVCIVSLLLSVLSFVGGLIGRILLTAVALYICFFLFPDVLEPSFNYILGGNRNLAFNQGGSEWFYLLVGYAILIKAILFILGGTRKFARDSLVNLFLVVTFMVPIRLLARGILADNLIAQAIVKSSFLSVFIVTSIGTMPPASQLQWDKIFDLYSRSNQSSARRELEQLAEKFGQGASI